MKIPLYTQEGSQSGEISVSEKLFGLKPNNTLVHRVLLMQLGNRRHSIAHTLTKGEVRGGGKKPHAQKHTGRARQGSITNPHHRGGGVAFGPRNVRNFTTRVPQKERQKALLCALSSKFKDGRIAALKDFSSENKKTKDFATMLKKLPFEKSVLFVLPEKNETVVRASRNIPRVKTLIVNYLNIADLLKYRNVVFFEESLVKLEQTFAAAN